MVYNSNFHLAKWKKNWKRRQQKHEMIDNKLSATRCWRHLHSTQTQMAWSENVFDRVSYFHTTAMQILLALITQRVFMFCDVRHDERGI